MTEIVLNTAKNAQISISGLFSSCKSNFYSYVNRKISRSELIFLAVTLSCMQILDGVLTCVGVLSFGSNVEANYLIRTLIENLGIIPALLMVKGFALLIIFTLCTMVRKVPWLATALKCIIVIYLFAAIVPWTMLLALKSA